MYWTWCQMTVILQSGLDISPVITRRFSHRDFEPAFEKRWVITGLMSRPDWSITVIWYQMTVMLQSGLDISPVITHRFSNAGSKSRCEKRRVITGLMSSPDWRITVIWHQVQYI